MAIDVVDAGDDALLELPPSKTLLQKFINVLCCHLRVSNNIRAPHHGGRNIRNSGVNVHPL